MTIYIIASTVVPRISSDWKKLADSAITDFMRTLHSLSEKQLVQVQQIQKEFQNEHFQMEGLSLLIVEDLTV
ncbi:hypothetical protein [Paenibacillus etheri]|uniref:Uncharacterized protein n=1 Tax=Paenibacillus etheri TaxID=1306852 RepID=A0A0W1AZR1_9BACL|nr:hypothetical protein [Paenibacillus etheri]KTD86821.1 hypothetical protein UQ64_15435 [Paenibacillus etheri]